MRASRCLFARSQMDAERMRDWMVEENHYKKENRIEKGIQTQGAFSVSFSDAIAILTTQIQAKPRLCKGNLERIFYPFLGNARCACV